MRTIAEHWENTAEGGRAKDVPENVIQQMGGMFYLGAGASLKLCLTLLEEAGNGEITMEAAVEQMQGLWNEVMEFYDVPEAVLASHAKKETH